MESRSSILSVSEMAVALDDVLAREFDRGRRLRTGLRTGVEASAPSVTWRVDRYYSGHAPLPLLGITLCNGQ